MDWDSIIGPHEDEQPEEVTSPPESSKNVIAELIRSKGEDDFTKDMKSLSKELQKDENGKIILPKIMALRDYDDEDNRAPELIEGLLRMGHKCMISAGSKAGKSFLAIEIGLLIAGGGDFIGHRCTKSSVLYVNLEIDENSFTYRCYEVIKALELDGDPDTIGNFKMLHLRGAALSLDKLAPALVDAINKEYVSSHRKFSTIILDPIYKISNGEENNARDVSRFCNQLDMIARATGCAIIYCHHHSKGDQGYKKAQDRASGSGVFARDADVIIDMVELEKDGQTVAALRDNYSKEHIREVAYRDYGIDVQKMVGHGHYDSAGHLISSMQQSGVSWETITELNGKIDKEFNAWLDDVTFMRVEYTVREFRTPKPQDIIFKYPIHYLDEEGILAGASPECHIQAQYKDNAHQANETKENLFISQVDQLLMMNGQTTIKEIQSVIGDVSAKTVTRRLKEHSDRYAYTPGDGRTEGTIKFADDFDKSI